MNPEANQRVWGLAASLVVTYLMTGYFSCLEVCYALWGKSAEATVVRVTDESRCRLGEHRGQARQIQYRFVDSAGTSRDGQTVLGVDPPRAPAVGEPIRIQYVAATNLSRILGESYSVPVYIFIPSSVLGFCGIYLAWLMWRNVDRA